MANASAKAAAETKKKPVAKKSAASAKKSKVKEEVVISSSDESDFDDDPDSVEVPGGGKDLKTIYNIGEPTTSKVAGPSVIPPKREGMMQQPGYDIIRVAPGASPFGLGPGIKQQSASVMQQAMNMAKSSASGVPIQVIPLSKVQSLLKTGPLQV